MTASVHFVLEPIELIAMDLALCITDHDPTATVFVAGSPQQGLDLLQGTTSVKVALIHADPTEFARTPLSRVLLDCGAVCVFMGDRAERSKANVLVLERPFSSQTIATLLQKIDTPTFAQ